MNIKRYSRVLDFNGHYMAKNLCSHSQACSVLHFISMIYQPLMFAIQVRGPWETVVYASYMYIVTISFPLGKHRQSAFNRTWIQHSTTNTHIEDWWVTRGQVLMLVLNLKERLREMNLIGASSELGWGVSWTCLWLVLMCFIYNVVNSKLVSDKDPNQNSMPKEKCVR